MFDENAQREIARVARGMKVEPAALLAVAEVESGGRISARIEGRNEPLIRFEGHYFHRLLSRAKRRRAVRAGLASPRAGAVLNPRTQKGRWKLLERARRIDRAAADASISWGLGQVMGANWQKLGYSSVAALVNEARSGVGGQVRLMARFIRADGLDKALRRRDWHGFARAYNGPAYAKNRYDERMAAAYRRHVARGANAIETRFETSEPPTDTPRVAIGKPDPSRRAPPRWRDVTGERPVLTIGLRGDAVRRVQRALGLSVDGLYGPRTRDAVRRFQCLKGLKADGMVGRASWPFIERRLRRQVLRSWLLVPWRWLWRGLRRMLLRTVARTPRT